MAAKFLPYLLARYLGGRPVCIDRHWLHDGVRHPAPNQLCPRRYLYRSRFSDGVRYCFPSADHFHPLVVVATVLLGIAVEKIAYKPLRTAPRMSVMISAIGMSYLLQNSMWYVTGGLAKQYPALPWISDTVTVLGCQTKRVTVVTPFLVIVLVAALVTLIQKTKIGMAMRAASRDFETAQLMGIKINNVISFTFAVGSFLAAIGSMMYFSNYTAVTPTVGAMPGLKAFVAAVFGGIGSIPGAVIGGFIIGICESLIKGAGATTFSDAFTFALLIVVLAVKPTGLFSENLTEKV